MAGEVIQCSSACTVTIEVAVNNTGNPFVMSVADGAVVSGSILLVWATAYGFRALGRVMLDRDTE